MHHARQFLAAQTADRARSQSVARDRIARRAAAIEAAQVATGVAASEADPALRDLLTMHAGVLDGLPPITPDNDADADPAADAEWLDKHVRVAAWQDVMQRVRADITSSLITSILRIVVVASLLVQSLRHAVRIRNILSRLARDILSALILARMRVIHICISARIQRAGRAAALASAGPAHC